MNLEQTNENQINPEVTETSDVTNHIEPWNTDDIKKAVISLSGGLDSSCLLMELFAQGIEEVHAYSFYYGQKHMVELKKVRKNIKFLREKGFNIEHQIINLTDVFNESTSSLHQGGEDIPEGDYHEESMKSTVVENRNIIFSSIIYGKALAWANKTNENVLITLGIHAGDHAIYPDCRPESQETAAHLFKISNWGSEKVDYVAPFEYLDKAHVLMAGLESMRHLGFTKTEITKYLRNTHTCYNPDESGKSCGKCGSCTERIEAFAYNHLKDPIKYQVDINWKAEFAKYKH